MRTGIIVIWAIAAVFALLCENSVLPTGYIAGTPCSEYVCDSLSAFSAIGGAWLLLQRSRFSVKLRLLSAIFAVFPSLIIYYSKNFASSAIYCLAIGLTATLAAWIIAGERSRKQESSADDNRTETLDKP